MSTRYYSSTAQPTTLSAAATDVATSIQVAATTGFPAAPFILALDFGATEQEVVLVTGVAGTTLTVTRGFDSTTSQSHSLGAAVRHVHSADDFRLSRTHEAASSGVHGVTGSLVGTTDAQVVTNKDLTSGTNTFPASLATDAEVTTAVGNHAALTATHGVAGAIVGTSDAQALTNKDLTSGTNVFPTSLATLAGAQTLTNKTLTAPVIDTLAGVTGVGKSVYVVRSADQSVANTTFVDDNTLTVAVAANATYIIDYACSFTCSTAGGAQLRINGPAGATASNSGLLSAVPLQLSSSTGATAPTFGSQMPTRLVTGGTAGNVTMQFAQFTNDATATIIKAGSFMRVTRIA